MLKVEYISQLSSVEMNRHAKRNFVIRDVKTRYMLWPGIKYPMHSFQSMSDMIYLFPDVLKLDYSSQLSSIGETRPAKQNDVIRDHKKCNMLWPGIM
jgi:hypothetical protein